MMMMMMMMKVEVNLQSVKKHIYITAFIMKLFG